MDCFDPGSFLSLGGTEEAANPPSYLEILLFINSCIESVVLLTFFSEFKELNINNTLLRAKCSLLYFLCRYTLCSSRKRHIKYSRKSTFWSYCTLGRSRMPETAIACDVWKQTESSRKSAFLNPVPTDDN